MPKILVVDDCVENRALAQATLQDEGYGVVLAETGGDAIRAFKAGKPDCVLLDVRMPGMDGFAVCACIRSLPGGAEVPIVFLTALRDVETFDRALRAGGDDFLTKPVRPTELIVRVHAALKLCRMSAELREHVDLVRRQRDDLMRLQLQKERLTAFVIHDLKNPVNSMDLHAQLLLRDPKLSEHARASVQHIRDEACSLLRLVLNLLDISTSEEGQLVTHPRQVDLQALIREVVEAHEVKAKAAQVSLVTLVEARSVLADGDLLWRVLENLVDNAIRHAPAGTEIRVSTHYAPGNVEIQICDAGLGIPEAMREKVFERFVQVEDSAQIMPRMGRGLGLTFCKLAVEAHGGKIWVEDSTVGATFCVRLPNE
jgi:two-component system, sensor histidine kinase and response regulator